MPTFNLNCWNELGSAIRSGTFTGAGLTIEPGSNLNKNGDWQKWRRLEWAEKELQLRRKRDKQKARLAAQLRQETTLRWAWLTQRLWATGAPPPKLSGPMSQNEKYTISQL